MSTLQKIAEAKKARILAEAHQKAAEVDRDMENLERLAAKYGLSVTTEDTGETMANILKDSSQKPEAEQRGERVASPPQTNGNGILLTTPSHLILGDMLGELGDASVTRRARVAAKAYIRAKNRPVRLAELDQVLTENGIRFESDTPRNTLSAVLGQDPELYSISREQGWWIKGLPQPEIRRRASENGSGHGG